MSVGAVTGPVTGLLRWSPGIALATWRYLTRPVPLYRTARHGAPVRVPALDASFAGDADLQRPEDGVGPLFHRRYRVLVRDAVLRPEQLVDALVADLNAAAPREVAVFVQGARSALHVGEDLVIRLPGPWDGPVRVVARTPTCFRFATRRGHLEAGQIEFRAGERDGELLFEIESWARSGDRLADLLYDRLGLSQELQLHMWSHFCQRAAVIAGGVPEGVAVCTSRTAYFGGGAPST